jgi:hypothetical protein
VIKGIEKVRGAGSRQGPPLPACCSRLLDVPPPCVPSCLSTCASACKQRTQTCTLPLVALACCD